jgi:hypothetical protein
MLIAKSAATSTFFWIGLARKMEIGEEYYKMVFIEDNKVITFKGSFKKSTPLY